MSAGNIVLWCPQCGRKFKGAYTAVLCPKCRVREREKDARRRRVRSEAAMSDDPALFGDPVGADTPSRVEWRGQRPNYVRARDLPRPETEGGDECAN